jgi:methionine synthase I (cobalamin-dependent)
MLQLHREFVLAGSDVLKSNSFFASDDRLVALGGFATFNASNINEAA